MHIVAGYVTHSRLKIRPPVVVRNRAHNCRPQDFPVPTIRQYDDSVPFLVGENECAESAADAAMSEVAMPRSSAH